MIEIREHKTHEQIVTERLIHGKDITKKQVQELGIFNNHYIDMLFKAGQSTVKHKTAEALSRSGMKIIKG